MKLKNVLDQLKEIAENNPSEDVARAIQTASAYSFKDRLAEMEAGDKIIETDQGVYSQAVEETSDEGEEQFSPNDEGEGDFADEAFDRIADRVENRHSGEGDDDAELAQMGKNAGLEETGDEEEMGSALDRVVDRCKRSGDGGPVDRIVDRVASRNSDGLGDDPWGIGETETEAADDFVPDDIQVGEGPRDRIHDRVAARGGIGGEQGLGEDEAGHPLPSPNDGYEDEDNEWNEFVGGLHSTLETLQRLEIGSDDYSEIISVDEDEREELKQALLGLGALATRLDELGDGGHI